MFVSVPLLCGTFDVVFIWILTNKSHAWCVIWKWMIDKKLILPFLEHRTRLLHTQTEEGNRSEMGETGEKTRGEVRVNETHESERNDWELEGNAIDNNQSYDDLWLCIYVIGKKSYQPTMLFGDFYRSQCVQFKANWVSHTCIRIKCECKTKTFLSIANQIYSSENAFCVPRDVKICRAPIRHTSIQKHATPHIIQMSPYEISILTAKSGYCRAYQKWNWQDVLFEEFECRRNWWLKNEWLPYSGWWLIKWKINSTNYKVFEQI